MKTPTDPTHLANPKENAEPVNLEGFREVADGEESERIKLLKLYVGQLKQKLPQARAALERKEFPQAASILHPLTGATFTCGLEGFGVALRSLEESAKVGDATAVTAMMPQIFDDGRRIEAAIVAELKRCS